jgi:hypothetical protein
LSSCFLLIDFFSLAMMGHGCTSPKQIRGSWDHSFDSSCCHHSAAPDARRFIK